MRRFLPFGLVVLHLVSAVPAAHTAEIEVLQPVESRSSLVLESTLGKARVEGRGMAPQRVPLRADERLSAIVETRQGWTAAGIREEDEGSQIIVFERNQGGTRRVATPGQQRHPLRVRPNLAVQREELQGMAWLEGTDLLSLSVRAADRSGDDWDEVAVVAPPARGSQTGLVNAVLPDGRWLLVWSAFDGTDDELLWSVGKRQDWALPRPVAKRNNTPDIMPALASTTQGAVLTWSRLLDGEYRLMLSRFDKGSWSRPQVVGPPGSLDAGFAFDGNRLFLVYRHAWPRGWAISEMTSQGTGDRIAIILDDSGSRPALISTSGEGVELRWPDRQRQSVRWEILP